MRTRPWGRFLTVAALLLVSLVALLPQPAMAADPGPTASQSPITTEGGTSALRDQLDATQAAWLDAKTALDTSVAHQQELVATLTGAQKKIDDGQVELGKIANVAFVSSGYDRVVGIVAGSVQDYLDGAGLIDLMALRQTTLIQQLVDAKTQAAAAQSGIDAEVAKQQELEQEMYKRNQEAEQALWGAAGGQDTGGFSTKASTVAQPAPRNADGSWPAEYIPSDRPGSTAVLERTVTGEASAGNAYITPRTAHAVQQAKAAGFTRFVGCYRSTEDGGEHPRGRACDFAVSNSCVFCGSAVGDERDYGNQLAEYFVFNADRLGVLYVIFYRQIWLASTGRWKSYSGCCDPSSMHTNHVHVSIK
jgi:hypothetical protein